MGKLVAVVLLVAVVAGGWMYFTDTDISDDGIEVRGPEVTRTEDKEISFNVPTYDIDAPDDDDDGEEDEIIDDDGINTPNDDDTGEPDRH